MNDSSVGQETPDGKRQRLDAETWCVLEMLHGKVDSVPRDEFNSARRFIERIGCQAVIEAAERAVASAASWRNIFRYFCGVCWNKVREIER